RTKLLYVIWLGLCTPIVCFVSLADGVPFWWVALLTFLSMSFALGILAWGLSDYGQYPAPIAAFFSAGALVLLGALVPTMLLLGLVQGYLVWPTAFGWTCASICACWLALKYFERRT